MKNIFYLWNLEWLKLKSYRMFKAVILLYVLLMPAMFLIGKAPGELPQDAPIPSFYSFPAVWSTLGYLGNWMVFFFFGFLTIQMVTREYANKTFRQNIMTGISRNEFVLSKIVMIFTLALGATAYYVLVATVFGITHTSYIKDWTYAFEDTSYIYRFGLMSFGYMIFAMMIAFIVRRSGLALLAFVVYTFFIEPLLRYWPHTKLFGKVGRDYYPLNVMEDLAYPEFFDRFVRVTNGEFVQILPPTTAIVLTMGYTALFIGITYWIVNRRDL